MCNVRRAFSLLEMLLVCFLFGLIFALVLQVLLPMAQGTLRGSQQTELQQLACLAIERLAVEVEETGPAAIGILPQGPGELPLRLALHPFSDVGPGGAQVYAPDTILYWWDQTAQRLWRSTWRPGSAEPAMMLPSSADFDAQIASPPVTARVLMSGLSILEISPAPNQLRIHMILQAPPADGRPPERFEVIRNVFLCNNSYL